MQLFLFLTQTSFAQEYYHPQSIAAKSKVFVEASKIGRQKSSKLEEELRKQHIHNKTLRRVGAIVQDEFVQQWAAQIASHTQQNRTKAEQFIHRYQEDFSLAFQTRYQKSLQKHPEAVLCLPNPMLRKKCPGTDISAKIAAKLDQDHSLQTELTTINAREWPTFSLPSTNMDSYPQKKGEFSIQLPMVLHKLLSKELEAHEASYIAKHKKLDATSATYKNQEDSLYTQYQVALKKEFTILEKILKHSIRKLRSSDSRFGDVSWCLNPIELGGCSTKDLSSDFLEFVEKDKKSQKLLKKKR